MTTIDAVRQLYESDRRELFAYALSLTGNAETAEDLVHEAVIRILHRSRRPRSLRPFIFSTIHNLAVDGFRRDRRWSLGEMPNAPDPQQPTGLFESADLDAAFSTLGRDERSTIILKIFAGFSFREIARVRRKSPNTVASWYRRGIEKMRQALEAL